MSFIRDYLEENPELSELSAKDLKKHLEDEGFARYEVISDDVLEAAREVFTNQTRTQNKEDSKVEQFLEDQRL